MKAGKRESHPVTLLGNAGLLGRKTRARFPDPSKEEMLATIREMGLTALGVCGRDGELYGEDATACHDRQPATPTCGFCRFWTVTGECE